MASCFFLLRQFEDVLIYLSSIKSYFFNDDSFNFNFAQVCVLHNLTRIETSVFGGRLFSIVLELKLRMHRMLPSSPLVHFRGMQVTSRAILYLCCFPLSSTACTVHSSGPFIQKIKIIQTNTPILPQMTFELWQMQVIWKLAGSPEQQYVTLDARNCQKSCNNWSTMCQSLWLWQFWCEYPKLIWLARGIQTAKSKLRSCLICLI